MAVPQRFVLRPHHHRIAFLLASGKRVMEISSELAISPSRITELNKIPEFTQEIEKLKNQRDSIELDEFRQVNRVRAAIHLMALEEIARRLEEDPEKIPLRDLNELQADCADRMGLSKVSRQESISMSVDLADSLAEARRRELKLVNVDERNKQPVDERED